MAYCKFPITYICYFKVIKLFVTLCKICNFQCHSIIKTLLVASQDIFRFYTIYNHNYNCYIMIWLLLQIIFVLKINLLFCRYVIHYNLYFIGTLRNVDIKILVVLLWSIICNFFKRTSHQWFLELKIFPLKINKIIS